MLRRFFQGSFARRILFPAVCAFTVALIVLSGGCMVVSHRAANRFHPINDPMSAEHRALIAGIPKYQRPESATYLTFPEWYLVFNPQEYAQSLAQHPPSRFP